MHLKLIVTGLIILAFSCSKTGNNSKQTANQLDSIKIVDSRSLSTSMSDSAAETSQPDSADTIFSFGTELVEQKKACYAAFKSIRTSSDFLKAYHLLNQLEIDMNAVFNKMSIDQDYSGTVNTIDKMMGNAIPCISTDMAEEGTIPVSAINNRELQKTTLLSPETDDDAFVDLLLTVYGDFGSRSNGLPVWTIMNCDVCYASVLGNGATYKVFQKIDSIKTVSPLFASVADSIMGEFFIGESRVFESTKEEIVAEIDTINATINLTNARKAFLANCREAVSDTSKSHVQINCSNHDCTY